MGLAARLVVYKGDHMTDSVWLRDIDGTGSLHPCAKGDPGAIEYVPAHPEELQTFYVHHNGAAWFVKDEELFTTQRGHELEWGRNWEPIKAPNLTTAREVAQRLNTEEAD